MTLACSLNFSPLIKVLEYIFSFILVYQSFITVELINFSVLPILHERTCFLSSFFPLQDDYLAYILNMGYGYDTNQVLWFSYSWKFRLQVHVLLFSIIFWLVNLCSLFQNFLKTWFKNIIILVIWNNLLFAINSGANILHLFIPS